MHNNKEGRDLVLTVTVPQGLTLECETLRGASSPAKKAELAEVGTVLPHYFIVFFKYLNISLQNTRKPSGFYRYSTLLGFASVFPIF